MGQRAYAAVAWRVAVAQPADTEETMYIGSGLLVLVLIILLLILIF